MNFESLLNQIQSVQTALQNSTAHAINTGLTFRNWLIGYYIVEFEQNGNDRAQYGEKLLKNLENRLNTKGMTERRFREFRQFYSAYPQLGVEITNLLPLDTIKLIPNIDTDLSIWRMSTTELQNEKRHLPSAVSSEPIWQTTSAELEIEKWRMPSAKFKGVPSSLLIKRLPYSNLLNISKFEDPLKRAFYEMECIKGNWSVSELERQINSLYFERSGLSKNKEALSNLANQKAIQLQPNDIINTPITLEFLGLKQRALVTETDLEQAILDNLQSFLLEMGHGFCFEARQKRILIDTDYFFVDLLFYHRLLKCHVVVELKMDKFKHEHASQLNMYLNYFKHEVMTHDDNPPIGILLCTDKGNTQVKYATGGLDQHIFVQKYLVDLPSENELKAYITKELEK
ncbi:MAG: PDDEXK nuclease domain-containing protein [Paludibacter sp.]|nr:PDDEXK nuclease domain-containing protein [Paludibacter sp.]